MALPSHTPATWNDILTTTMHNYRKQLTDNIFNGRPLLNFYMSNGRVSMRDGGITIVEPLMIYEGDFQAYTEWEQVVVTPVNTATAAQFPWRQLVATIAISGLEEAQNNGKQMIINLLEAKIMQAETTLKGNLNKMLFGTYVGADAAKGFTSLQTLIDSTTPVGGIDPATETYWKSIESAVGAVDAAGLEAAMRTAYNLASDSGNDRVDAIFTAADVFEFYESTLTPQVRYTDTEKANLGFQNLLFKNVPIFWDFDCPAGTMFGLNSKYVGLVLHSERNFKQSPFTDNLSGSVSSSATAGKGVASAYALDARVSFITTYGEQTIRNRRRNFKLTGITKAP